MIVSGLWVQGFRNFADTHWEFDPGLNVLTAPNGSGKSNMVEALSLLSTGHSWRARQTDEFIAWDESIGRIQAKVILNDGTALKLEQIFTHGELQGRRTNKRSYKVNDVARRSSDAIGQFLTVLFLPEDMEIFQAGASARRRLLDEVLDQVSREYRYGRAQYEKALRRRNKLLQMLREGTATRADFFYYDQLLLEHGAVIHAERQKFLSWLSGREGVREQYQVEYDHSVMSEARLEQYARAEVSAGHTLVGPHKDDVILSVKRGGDWRDLERFGSRGEQRLALVWWKLQALEYLENVRGERPVLLLDDVYSELDSENQLLLTAAAAHSQAIITTVEAGHRDLRQV